MRRHSSGANLISGLYESNRQPPDVARRIARTFAHIECNQRPTHAVILGEQFASTIVLSSGRTVCGNYAEMQKPKSMLLSGVRYDLKIGKNRG
jgi:hypothetical protein